MSKVNRLEDKQLIIVRLLPPARPLLPRVKSPLRTIFNSHFEQLPAFESSDAQQKLNTTEQFAISAIKDTSSGYLIYERNISELWNFSIAKSNVSGEIHYASNEKVLEFHSNFESGNLKRAFKLPNRNEYNLLMQRDINTYGYTQWFFFKVCNSVAGQTCRFNITNFYKQKSLFTKGMKVLVYSVTDSQKGWHRDGSCINYSKNYTIEKYPECRAKELYTLTFQYKFEHTDDMVYFACNYPYTYSDLRNYIQNKETAYSGIFTKNTICRTLAGNRIEVLTITNRSQVDNKRVIIVTARLHPGQTVSSFIAKGMIDFLLNNTDVAKALRDKFIFKIIPMMNPDGVIHGNYRTSLSGRDLNRRWSKTSKEFEPEIFNIKEYIRELSQKYEIVLVCDLHGHSRKKDVFAYACMDSNNMYRTRQLPFIFSKISKNFNFNSCTFGIDESKMGTLRAFFWKEIKVQDVITLETSLCGSDFQNNHFTTHSLQILGQKLCESIHLYFEPSSKQELTRQLYYQTLVDHQDSDSDSNPDEFEMSVVTLKKLQKGRFVMTEPRVQTRTIELSTQKEMTMQVQMDSQTNSNKQTCFRQTKKICTPQRSLRHTFFMSKRMKTEQSVPRLRLDEQLEQLGNTLPKFLRKQSFAKSIYTGFNKYTRVRTKHEQGVFQGSKYSANSRKRFLINESVINSSEKVKIGNQVLLVEYQDFTRQRIRRIFRNR